MKRLLACVLVLSFFSDLSSCGLNPEIKRVSSMISALGEVTEESGDAIAAAEAAYDALSEGARKKVDNAGALVNARETYDRIVGESAQEDSRQAYVGIWTELSDVLPAFRPITSWFGTLELKEDGVFGLQRGFKKAGAKTLLMSLWSVDDEATQMMMTSFYHTLFTAEGTTVSSAFRTALQTLRDNGFDAPYYWASFVLLDE